MEPKEPGSSRNQETPMSASLPSLRILFGGLTRRVSRNASPQPAERSRLQVEHLEDRLAQSGLNSLSMLAPTIRTTGPVAMVADDTASVAPVIKGTISAAAATSPELTLELTSRSGSDITLTLNSFQFGSGSANDLTAKAPVNAAISELLHDAALGIGFTSAKLVDYIPTTHASITWNLSDVYLASESVGVSGVTPVETLEFVFASKTEIYDG
jgi:hypothetical protein